MASSLSTPTPITTPFAVSGNRNTIPIPSQIGVTDGAASYTDGFPPLTMTPLSSGGKPPAGPDMNGVLFEITTALRYLGAGGRAKFSSALAVAIGGYPVGSVLQDNSGANEYINIVDGNSIDFNNTPSAIGVSWILYGSNRKQTWQSLTLSRALGTTYTNGTSKEIEVNASVYDANTNNGTTITFYINGALMGYGTSVMANTVGFLSAVSFRVPSGDTYAINQTQAGIGTLYSWSELR